VNNWRKGLDIVAGARPESCPWRAYYDPVVAAVLDALRSCATGDGYSPAMLLPLDPPHAVWEGVHEYLSARAKIDAHDRRLEEQNRKNRGPR
jgi:hypothetical protein